MKEKEKKESFPPPLNCKWMDYYKIATLVTKQIWADLTALIKYLPPNQPESPLCYCAKVN